MRKEKLDCQAVMDLLDAYALGAVDKAEAKEIEAHVADCVRCWDELNRAQRTAALLVLSVPVQEAPAALGERIIGMARDERRLSPFGQGWLQRLGLGRPVAVGAVGVAGLAALVFSAFLQVQMNDLRDENGSLERQVAAADTELAQQQQVQAVLAASDTQKLPIIPTRSSADVTGDYTWSAAEGIGMLNLRDLQPLSDQQVYQMWFTFGSQALPAGTCVPLNGRCDFIVYFGSIRRWPDGVGVSVEPAGGSVMPNKPWFLFARFEGTQ